MSFTQTDKAFIIGLCHYAVFIHNLPTARTVFIFFRATHLKTANAPSSLKRRKFDVFKPHKYTVSCGDPVTFLGKFLRGRVRVANLVFEITLSQAITLTLLLVCSFSPRVHSIPRGPQNSLKRREFDGFLGFFAGSENPSVLSVHEFSGSVKTPKRRELSPFS